MLNIVFMKKYEGESQLFSLSANRENEAKRFKEGDSLNWAFTRGLLFTIPIIVIEIFFSLKRISEVEGALIVNANSFFLMLLMGGAVLISKYLHEIIHALAYPFSEKKYLFFSWRTGFFFVYCNSIISKARFVFVNLLPVVIQGFLVFFLWYFWLYSVVTPIMSVLMLLYSWYMTIFSSVDCYNAYYTMLKIPSKARVFNYGLHSFWVP